MFFLAQVQFKGRQLFETGRILLAENHEAWLSQTSADKIVSYNSRRSTSSRWKLVRECAQLLTNKNKLQYLGFPRLNGFSEMPDTMYISANALASDFADLVISHMSNIAWDFAFWSDQWPHKFAGLLHQSDSVRTQVVADLQAEWKCVQSLENILFPEPPKNAKEAEVKLCESSAEYAELAICQHFSELILFKVSLCHFDNFKKQFNNKIQNI